MGTGIFPAFMAAWLQIIVPQPCYDRYFIDFNFFDGHCLKVVISKALGFAIILGSFVVKLPQIVKLFRAKSGEGISLLSVTCELLAISASWSYGYASKFPFSAYGEAVSLAVQTVLVAFLVLVFEGRRLHAVLYTLTYVAAMAFLLSPLAPFTLLSYLQASNALFIMCSKLIQAYTNYSNQSTGQLSAITVLLIFVGALGRIFTSIQETGDSLVVFTYIVSSLCNAIIVFQLIRYWNNEMPKDHED